MDGLPSGKGVDEYDRTIWQRRETAWIQQHGTAFQPLPDVFCMSWRWPRSWGPPAIFTRPEQAPRPTLPTDPAAIAAALQARQTFHRKGLPMRLLRFPSGTEVWQLVTPVHGFDEPGATLPDPRETHLFPW